MWSQPNEENKTCNLALVCGRFKWLWVASTKLLGSCRVRERFLSERRGDAYLTCLQVPQRRLSFLRRTDHRTVCCQTSVTVDGRSVPLGRARPCSGQPPYSGHRGAVCLSYTRPFVSTLDPGWFLAAPRHVCSPFSSRSTVSQED